MTNVSIRVRFEAGHRLPQLPGKCHNLHGHSWQGWITVAGTMNDQDVVVDFGELKAALQRWVDQNLDHGMLLGAEDEWAARLVDGGLKVFRFGEHRLARDLSWPTVEAVAELLSRVAAEIVGGYTTPLRVARVVVQETENNRAEVAP
ncbi:6-pyruvoyl trahydropterin synthase family protein [Amycolatopsis thermophila]|uniref:6-carboxy-5,6,7,8-tetrahydropterin synthase n=1 Tax=Amycolatopsis thermophila TaxID=206084 RepID=A0ABU0EMW6_9PSEU|nr:6-carboxytetrahydropterin synthase [Amycolatopsis thermophila]MDQ0376509.1 6-pyruvoyltetrahydropterin/6-carboxytetrahydropterin synthase [Amycolatopsis thermophila]